MSNLWKFTFATGMRTSEFIAVQWDSIDMTCFQISVDQVRVEGITKDDAKTLAGLRKIDRVNGTFEALSAQSAYTKLAGGLAFLDARYDAP